jgi:phytanoyl-CoA hydroxylase
VKKFQLGSNITELKEYYNEMGYVVIANCIHEDAIRDFLVAYEKVKKSRHFVYYSQSIHNWIRPQLSNQGYICDSFENATRLANAPAFASAIKRILFDPKISQALNEVTGFSKFVSWQDMFFDRSTGTIDHQDSWYLDTLPNGYLIGAWYALEDIQTDCGVFYVYPKSHKLERLDRSLNHDDFRERSVQQVIDAHIKPKKALLKQGDLLLWHPHLLHGSESCQNENNSRKSFTSHFYPLGFSRDTKEKSTDHLNDLKRDLSKCVPTLNDNIFQLSEVHPYVSTAKGILKSLLKRGKPLKDMRRASYD